MCFSLKNQKRKKFFVDSRCHPQNIALVKTRGDALGMVIEEGNLHDLKMDFSKTKDYCGVMVQYPDTYGGVYDWSSFCAGLNYYYYLLLFIIIYYYLLYV